MEKKINMKNKIHFLEHDDKWNKHDLGMVKTLRVVRNLPNIDHIFEESDLNIDDCVSFITIDEDSIEIKIQELTKESVYRHIDFMERLADKLPEKGVEIYLDDSDPENPKFSFERAE